MRKALGVLAGLVLLQGVAQAGRRPFLYAKDTATVPEGDVELEMWLDYINTKGENNIFGDVYRWWIGPCWSPFDGFELTALTSFNEEENLAGRFGLWAELLEGRWRSPATAAGSLLLQFDFRISLDDDLPHQLMPQVGWVKRGGRFVGTAQIGYAHGIGTHGKANYDWMTFRAGAAVDVVRGEISAPVQLGVETFGEIMLTDTSRSDLATGQNSAAFAGPTISVARGRLWLTTGILFGLSDKTPTVLSRAIIGLAL
jgi:hypothetical protein